MSDAKLVTKGYLKKFYDKIKTRIAISGKLPKDFGLVIDTEGPEWKRGEDYFAATSHWCIYGFGKTASSADNFTPYAVFGQRVYKMGDKEVLGNWEMLFENSQWNPDDDGCFIIKGLPQDSFWDIYVVPFEKMTNKANTSSFSPEKKIRVKIKRHFQYSISWSEDVSEEGFNLLDYGEDLKGIKKGLRIPFLPIYVGLEPTFYVWNFTLPRPMTQANPSWINAETNKAMTFALDRKNFARFFNNETQNFKSFLELGRHEHNITIRIPFMQYGVEKIGSKITLTVTSHPDKLLTNPVKSAFEVNEREGNVTDLYVSTFLAQHVNSPGQSSTFNSINNGNIAKFTAPDEIAKIQKEVINKNKNMRVMTYVIYDLIRMLAISAYGSTFVEDAVGGLKGRIYLESEQPKTGSIDGGMTVERGLQEPFRLLGFEDLWGGVWEYVSDLKVSRENQEILFAPIVENPHFNQYPSWGPAYSSVEKLNNTAEEYIKQMAYQTGSKLFLPIRTTPQINQSPYGRGKITYEPAVNSNNGLCFVGGSRQGVSEEGESMFSLSFLDDPEEFAFRIYFTGKINTRPGAREGLSDLISYSSPVLPAWARTDGYVNSY